MTSKLTRVVTIITATNIAQMLAQLMRLVFEKSFDATIRVRSSGVGNLHSRVHFHFNGRSDLASLSPNSCAIDPFPFLRHNYVERAKVRIY